MRKNAKTMVGGVASMALLPLALMSPAYAATEISGMNPTPVTEGTALEFSWFVDNTFGDQTEIVCASTTSGGTATANDDFTPVAEDPMGVDDCVTVTMGQSTTLTLTVLTSDDLVDEADETVLAMAQDFDGDGPPPVVLTGTIQDNDGPTATVENDTVVEGTAPASSSSLAFPVTLSALSPEDVVVTYTVTPGSASTADYTAPGANASITIPAGQQTGTIVVPVTADSIAETVENLTVTVSDAGGDTATGFIEDDDAAPFATVEDTQVTEATSPGTSSLQFPVTLAAVAERDVVVTYTVTPDTATTADYTAPAANASITIPAGEQSGTIVVPVTADNVDEAAEKLTVTITDMGGDTATGTINDDDPTPTATVEDTEAAESDGDGTAGTLTFPVILSAASEQDVVVSYSIVVETATKRGDYAVPDDRTVRIPAGETDGVIELGILDDETDEPNETVGIRINDAGSDTAQGTILDDDAAPVITIGDVRQAEGTSSGDDNELLLQRRANGWFNGTAFRFPVRLSAPSGKTVTVQYSTVDGTATSPSDFVAANGETLTFAPGQTEQEVFVEVMADSLVESTETFTVELTAPVNTVIGDGSGLGIIENDDRVASEPQPAPPVEEPSASPSATAPVTASPSATATASATPTATTSAAPTASAAPSPTGSVTPPPAVTCANPVGFTLNRDFIVPGIPVTATITGPAGAVVAIQAYSRPSTDYRQVRSTTIPGNGQVSFDLVPGTNTRLFAECVDQPGSVSAQRVINVRTALSLTVVRNGTRDYTFQGRILPRRADQLITLYRVTDRGARVLTSQLKTDDTGTYRIDRTFSGSGTFGFLTRTGQTLTNNAGESNTPTTVAGIRSGRGVPRPTAIF